MLLRTQGEEKGKMSEARSEETTAENFSKVMKDIIIPQIQEASQIPRRINKKRSTLRHTVKRKKKKKTADKPKMKRKS